MASNGQSRQDRVDEVVIANGNRVKRMMAVGAGIMSCTQVAQMLDEMIPRIEAFVRERERLGEYDASAAAIIEMAKAMLRLAEFQRATLQATIDFALAD